MYSQRGEVLFAFLKTYLEMNSTDEDKQEAIDILQKVLKDYKRYGEVHNSNTKYDFKKCMEIFNYAREHKGASYTEIEKECHIPSGIIKSYKKKVFQGMDLSELVDTAQREG